MSILIVCNIRLADVDIYFRSFYLQLRYSRVLPKIWQNYYY